ncbi:MAG: hypothetical protein KF709_03605 [Gemmatimonadaceae bacterium]|nr:hypothetical protein [Gemmatimonadaceae bacterium]
MIRRTFGAAFFLPLLLTTSIAGAQVVGHLPAESPYTDATGRHMAALHLGWFIGDNDKAGVAPKSGLALMGRYEYDVPGPLWLSLRGGLVPGIERDIKDPLFAGPLRNAGTRSETLGFFDGGLVLSLTGDKAWKGLAPRAHGNLGAITSFTSDFDIGGYRFGPKLMLSWGLGVRTVNAGKWEWSVDLTHALYRLNYPASFQDQVTSASPSILGTGRTNPWSGNLILSASLTRVWGK